MTVRKTAYQRRNYGRSWIVPLSEFRNHLQRSWMRRRDGCRKGQEHLDLNRFIIDEASDLIDHGFGVFAGQQSNVDLGGRLAGNDVDFVRSCAAGDRDCVGHATALTRIGEKLRSKTRI